MSRCDFEPTLADALSDPLVRAVMAADGVNVDELQNRLNQLGEKLRRRRETESRRRSKRERQAAE